jgi:hypothetical protein
VSVRNKWARRSLIEVPSNWLSKRVRPKPKRQASLKPKSSRTLNATIAERVVWRQIERASET